MLENDVVKKNIQLLNYIPMKKFISVESNNFWGTSPSFPYKSKSHKNMRLNPCGNFSLKRRSKSNSLTALLSQLYIRSFQKLILQKFEDEYIHTDEMLINRCNLSSIQIMQVDWCLVVGNRVTGAQRFIRLKVLKSLSKSQ